MGRYLIECTIDQFLLERLVALRAEHYEFLIEYRDHFVFGGPVRGTETGPPQAMVMVVEAATIEEAQLFIAGEPYNRSGCFSAVTVRAWNQVIPEHATTSLQGTLDAERAARGGS